MAVKLFCDRCGEEAGDQLFRLVVTGQIGRPGQTESWSLIGPTYPGRFEGPRTLTRDLCSRCFDEVGVRLHRVLDENVKPGETDAILGRIGELADGGLCEDADGARNALGDILKLVERWEKGAGVGA